MESEHKIGHLASWHHPAKGTAGKRVLMVHGLGEHSERHRGTVDFLVSRGIEVVRFDARGCGRSEGPRQWIEAFQDYVDDTDRVVTWISKELDTLPLYLFGHSLGGAIAVNYATGNQDKLAGLILSAPAYLPGTGISPVKIAVGRLINRVLPKARIPGSLDVTGISRDPAEVERYKADPLICTFNTVRQGSVVLDTLPLMPERMKELKLPVFLAHGTGDRIVQYAGSEALFEACASNDKILKTYPGAYHELHNDLDRQLYFQDLEAWLLSH